MIKPQPNRLPLLDDPPVAGRLCAAGVADGWLCAVVAGAVADAGGVLASVVVVAAVALTVAVLTGAGVSDADSVPVGGGVDVALGRTVEVGCGEAEGVAVAG
jgi:hypothetical protein